jgi:hypothetical protein
MDHAYCGIRSGFISVGFVLIVAWIKFNGRFHLIRH